MAMLFLKQIAQPLVVIACGLTPAFAGGLATTPEPAAPVAAPAEDWAGLYAGATLGYGFNGDDRLGIRDAISGTLLGDAGDISVSGAEAGLRIGYRWQRGGLVFGPELGFSAADISDSASGVVDGVASTGESTVTDLLALRFQTGFVTENDLLIFGTLGVARASIDYRLNGQAADYKTTGYIAGLGVEKAINTDWSLTGELEYISLGKETRTFGPVTTEATPSHTSVKVGLNYRF
ncbi:outer membrane protein [Rhodopseudomonas palustris]